MKNEATTNQIALITVLLVIALACSNHPEPIPLAEETNIGQPITAPFKFTEVKQLKWPVNNRPLKSQIKKIDFDKIPEMPFDSLGFLPLAKQPDEVPFDLDKLPDSAFNYNDLPSRTFSFKVSVLESPITIRANLHLKSGTHELLYEFGEPFTTKSDKALFEDRNGFTWIGTDQGLYRYDGQNLLLYRQVPSAFTFTEDNNGQIWMTLANGNGICVIDPRSNILKRLTTANGLTSNNVARMVTDSQNRVWAVINPNSDKDHIGLNIIDENNKSIKWLDEGTSNDNGPIRVFLDKQNNIWTVNVLKGIKIIDLKNQRVRFLNKNSGLLSDSTLRMFQDENNRIWVAEIGRINAIDIKRKTITHYDLGRLSVTPIVSDDQGNIWIGTNNGLGNNNDGIKIIDPVRKLFKTLNKASGLSSNEIGRLLKDNLGQIWILTEGLNIINKNNGSLLQRNGNVDIYEMVEDRVGNIWIATPRGIEVMDTSTNRVKILNTKNGISGKTINNLYEKDGKIWAVTENGIDVIDRAGKTIEHFDKNVSLSGNPSFINWTVSKDNKNKIWISTFGKNGLSADIFDLEKRTSQSLNIDPDLKDGSISYMINDRQGKIWIAYHTGGVKMIDPVNQTISFMKNESGMDDHYFKVLFKDQADNIWVGTDKGILIINADRDSVTRLSVGEGLINDQVTSLNQYKDRIYACTREGITIITPPSPSPANKTWKLRSIGRQQGIIKLNGNYGSDLITSDGKFLWGDKGIISIRDDSNAKQNAETHVSGIDIFNHAQSFSNKPWSSINKEDTLWGSKKDKFYVAGELPTDILFPGKSEIEFDSVSGYYNMPADLSLPHDQNYLQFHFTQVHGNSIDTTWYRYILEGVNKKWSDRTYLPVSENYLKLAPGNYTFKVSSLYNGVWTVPAEFSFKIRLPWWKRWWAYCLYVAALVTIITLVVQYRSRKLKAENLALEKKIDQRTAELQQSLQELRSTQTQLIQSEKMASLGELTAGIAHEIQNPLNFVNNFSEVNGELLKELKTEAEKGNLEEVKVIAKDIEFNSEKINHHGKRADAIVKGMLQHSRTSSGQKEPTDINALADEYLRLAYHGFRAKDKSFNATMKADFDENIGKINVVPQEIGRVILNLINNAFYAVDEKKKQNINGYEPTVSVSTKKNNSKVEIKVSDNGNGIPQNVLDKIFQPFFTTKPTGQGTGLGLSLSYDIVKAHGGELKVETKDGMGSEFIVNIPA